MRIILTFAVGLILFFFLSAALSKLFKDIQPIKKALRIGLSIVGLACIFLSVIIYLVAKQYTTPPLDVLLPVFVLGTGIGIIAFHLLSESFIISKRRERDFISKHDRKFERLLEILPGALMWTALTSPVWLSFTLPFALAYIILLADIYWLLTAFRIAILTYLGYKRMEFAKKQDWIAKLQTDFSGQWENYYQFIEIHSYKETLEVLKPAYDAVINSDYPRKKIFLGIGVEERASAEIISQVSEYAKKNSDKIGGIFFTIHPFGLPGELPGPATHRNWIMNNAAREFKKRGIKLEQVIVTTLDADFVIHPQFLAGALHKYLSTPEKVRDKRSFTGVFLYHNNYWQCPTPMRLIASGTAFWQLAEMVGSDKYINFSSLSINLKSLMDIGLWIPDKVNDDSGFFWKAYYHFKGDYKVIPHYMPISADTVLDVNLVKTFENQYMQLKRWAYGVEHVPFIIKKYFASRDLDFWDKTDKLIFILWSYFKWGTLALFVTFAGLFIPLVNPHYSQSVVAYNLPVISSWILTGAFFGLFTTIYIHEKTAPKRPSSWSFMQRIWSYIQWALIPIILVTITSIPAIDAQTRLMLGRYMEYRTTIKARTQIK